MKETTLAVLAAGMGSRYGGLKQIDPVGPNGEIILDYSIHDAMQGGFNKVVFEIRRDIEQAFREAVGAKWEKRSRCFVAHSGYRKKNLIQLMQRNAMGYGSKANPPVGKSSMNRSIHRLPSSAPIPSWFSQSK